MHFSGSSPLLAVSFALRCSVLLALHFQYSMALIFQYFCVSGKCVPSEPGMACTWPTYSQLIESHLLRANCSRSARPFRTLHGPSSHFHTLNALIIKACRYGDDRMTYYLVTLYAFFLIMQYAHHNLLIIIDLNCTVPIGGRRTNATTHKTQPNARTHSGSAWNIVFLLFWLNA